MEKVYMNEIKNNQEYSSWVKRICKEFKSSQIKAAVKVNSEMISFYFYLGSEINKQKGNYSYGDNFFKILSDDLKKSIPDVKSFSSTNLRYMERFYLLYKNFPQVEEKLSSIPWGHHKYIIDKFSDNPQKALFFVQKTLENNWSRAVLLNFLDTDLYERQGKAITNFSTTLPAIQSDLAQQITKDPYNFDFLTITEKYNEKELKDALIQNIEKFLLELGRGFAYMGREFRLQIGSEEKFLDMLFYNVNLHCYVVIEVKVEKFDPSHLGQLGLYVSGVNHILKRETDNPTIGLLICKSKDNIVAQYSLESSTQPIGISEYELTKLYPVDFKSSLPSIEEIEKELNDFKNIT